MVSAGTVATGAKKANAGGVSSVTGRECSEGGRSLVVTPPRSAKRRSKSSTASVAVFGFEFSGNFTEDDCFVSSVGRGFDIIILDQIGLDWIGLIVESFDRSIQDMDFKYGVVVWSCTLSCRPHR